MPISSSISPDSRNWRYFYKAAILELDSTNLPGRIAEAEKALIERARELFQESGDNLDEKQAVDDAMHALHALRRSCEGKRNIDNAA